MTTGPVQAVALEGLSRSSERLAQRAQEVAVPNDRVSLESSLVGAMADAVSYRANLKVLQTSSEFDETVFSLLAGSR